MTDDARITPAGLPAGSGGSVSKGLFPSGGGERMSKDKGRLPKDRNKGRGRLLTRVLRLVPLFKLMLQLFEIILKLVGKIN